MITHTVVQPVEPGSPWFAGAVDVLEQIDLETVGADAYEPQSVRWHEVSWRTPEHRRLAWVVVEDDQVVATARADLPRLDNTHLVELELGVRPAHRGRGHGRALLETLRAAVRDEGRDTVLGGTGYRPDPVEAWRLHEAAVADPGLSSRLEPSGTLGVSFARASGAQLVQTELRSQVRLPCPESRLAEVEAETAGHAEGYTTRRWHLRAPDDLMADRAELASRMSTDPPLGEVDFRAEHWDEDRMRQQYDDWERRGVDLVGAGAVSPDGRLVAFSEMGRETREPTLGYQFDTIVAPEHRGRRLGMLVKAANLRAVGALMPDVVRVQTWNALENGPMLRVNRAMGFVPVGLYSLWQWKL